MSGHVKTENGWVAIPKIPVRTENGLGQVVSSWHKMDTGWVRIWSSGAVIEYLDYPYPIPVMKGWQRSADGQVWTTIEADGELNGQSGVFTGFVKTKGVLSLTNYTNNGSSALIPVTEGSTYNINYEANVNVVNGGDWDMSNAKGIATDGNAVTISGITGSTPPISKVAITVYSLEYTWNVSDNDPNGVRTSAGFPAEGYDADTITLYDADGNVVASTVSFTESISESGTADVSEVMTIEGKTTGTIKYKNGDLLPGVQITVADADDNVVEGAEITISTCILQVVLEGTQDDWDEDHYAYIMVENIGDFPNASKIGVNYSSLGELIETIFEIGEKSASIAANYALLDMQATINLYDSSDTMVYENVPYVTTTNFT